MRALVVGAVAVLLLVGALVMPARVEAACGGVSDDGYLARYVGTHADTIVEGRLIDTDLEAGLYRFDVLTVYRGDAASPMEEAGVIDVGGCTGQSVEPGQRLIYAAGQDPEYGPVKVLFPHLSGGEWIIEHFGGTSSLQSLLGFLGVLPETSASEPGATGGDRSHFGVGAGTAMCAVAYLFLRRMRTRPAN